MQRTSRHGRAIAALSGALLAVVAAGPALAQGDGTGARGSTGDDTEAIVTAVDVRALSPTEPVRGSDGLVHLAYELLISNLSGKVVEVQQVEVLDPADRARTVATIDQDALGETMRIFGAQTSALIPAGSGATLFLDITLEPGDQIPTRLEHRFTTQLSDPSPLGPIQRTGVDHQLQEFVGGPERVVGRPAVVVAPPLRGDRWVIGNGCCASITAHRGATLPIDGTIHVPERYAIDFVQLDEKDRVFEGELTDNDSYPYYGDQIYAVAPGTVVGIQDGLDDQTPGQLPADATVQTAGGNYVVVDIGHGRYAFYAHMIPDSLRVKVGDRVATGDVLGRLGNSGNTDAAHLHFHVMDGPSPLTSNGLPFELTSFTVEGQLLNIEEVQAGNPARIDDTVDPGRHRRELPLNLEVVAFAAPGR